MSELKVKFRYENGTANDGKLEIYDAAIALRGIARASSIITHAYLNEEIRTHGDAVKGAKIYIETPKRGSFLYEACIWTTDAIVSGVFYDFIKYAFSETVGMFNNPDDYYKALDKKIEPTIGELPAVLESALDEMHRPIRHENDVILTVMRPRGEELARFNYSTLDYLQPSIIPASHEVTGTVTKYNSLTGWGKLYDLIEAQTISFNIDLNSSERERSLITWSLHQNNLNRNGQIYFSASAVVTPTNRIKRYIVRAVSDKPI